MMFLTVNKMASFFTICSLLGFFSNGTGFDFYAHSTVYYYFDQTLSPAYLAFDNIVIPRYLLLSVIYELTSRLGIPLGVVVTLMLLVPSYLIFHKIDKNSHKKKYSLTSLLIILITFFLITNYSALSISFLYIFTFLLLKKNFFSIGIFFHPVALLIGTIIIIFFRRDFIIKYIKLTFSIFLFFYISTSHSLLTAFIEENIKFSLTDSKIFIENLIFVLQKKPMEIGIAIITLISFYFVEKKLKYKMNKYISCQIQRTYAAGLVLMLSLFVSFYLFYKPSPNLIRSVLSADINDVIYMSWFDFGEKDIKTDYLSIFNERLIHVGGI